MNADAGWVQFVHHCRGYVANLRMKEWRVAMRTERGKEEEEEEHGQDEMKEEMLMEAVIVVLTKSFQFLRGGSVNLLFIQQKAL